MDSGFCLFNGEELCEACNGECSAQQKELRNTSE